MRADRLLSIVLLLQRHGHLTAKALSTTLGVTERTIYRDIEALSMAGVPVFTRTGPDGGCFLDEDYRSRLNWFTSTELQTLLYTSSASPLADLGMQQTMENAVLKLLAFIPSRHQHEAQQLQQRLYLDPTGWYGISEDRSGLPLLKEAVWNDLEIETLYEAWEGEQQRLTLAPHSLVYKAQRWYLIAVNRNTGKMRTYRVSRLTDVQLQTTHFERDPLFDITVYWAEASESFMQRIPSYPITLRVRPPTMFFFQHMMSGRYEILEQSDDWWVLRVHYTVFEEARSSVLGLGTEVEVIEPVALHLAVIEQAQSIVTRYAPPER